ncbi:MAG: phenylalanine--tRNA ligase subunit beta [Candidatus Solincola sediminis]|uniref:Phenylalanine--tRNA ligase beta subunit n=1 Tax=Candidatus Solincola sediminis TaxID=1797199 RepID=A0A1F2WGM8_9ACTN|nr:MAG: phenylalanine--tRNA ligase subunit beta [Candidatus Solincola sediminis]
MRVSLEWLSDYVDFEIDAQEIADLLTNSGTEVEKIETIGKGLEGFQVGLVLEVASHPRADRLSLCRVDIAGSIREVVCGAPNVKPGIKVPLAAPGSRLPNGTVIEEAVIRGISSHGMILSEKELGISEEASGIMVLDDAVEIGRDLASVLSMPDQVLVVEITPNRSDCLSMVGMAREVAALTGKQLKMPPSRVEEIAEPASGLVIIEILDPDLCSRYAARLIFSVKIGPSPWWIRRRLQAAGVRPISNVVDITNYVMLELGQPLHAFDYDLIEEGHIIVRRAKAGETLTTLDGVNRKLTEDSLLICDSKGAVALAGVMGGEESEVGERTSRILLESAHFDPPNIMRTARFQELPSEASYRFERGVDPNGCVRAADRAAELMRELAGGDVMAGAVDAHPRVIEPVEIDLRVARTGKLIGITLGSNEVADLLRSIELDMAGTKVEDGVEVVSVIVPTFRPDLEREIDLVEEVARLRGYQKISSTLPLTSKNIGGLSRGQKKMRSIGRTMAGEGLYEAITHAFISPRWLDILDPSRQYLPNDVFRVRNPISEEFSVMRPSLMPGLLETLRFNFNRRVTDLHLYEIGRVFLSDGDEKLPREPLRLGCIMSGEWFHKQWGGEREEADFYTIKGVLEELIGALNICDWDIRAKEFPFLHPAQSGLITIEGSEAGYIGTLHPRVAREAELPEKIAVMELDLESLIASSRDPRYREIPRFPAVQIDLAVVVAEDSSCARVEHVMREAGGPLLREVQLFDLYRGEQVGPGCKSLAFKLTFYALDRTLTDEEVMPLRDSIIETLRERFEARLR